MSFKFLNNDHPCMATGCERTTGSQSEDESAHGVYFCDARNEDTGRMMTREEGNHFLQFIDAVEADTVEQWLAENVR